MQGAGVAPLGALSDTNVLLDVILLRAPHVTASAAALDLAAILPEALVTSEAYAT